VEGATEGEVSGARLERPLDGEVVDNSQRIEVVLGEEILGIVELLRFLYSSEQVMRLADGDNSMPGARRGDVACLFDLLPSDRSRLHRA
jgi:hypothetical protein